MALAQERAAARAARDWTTADALKARLESHGWRVVDHGTAFELQPARPADVVEDGHVIHGAVESVPSRSHELDGAPASFVIASAVTGDLDATLASLAAYRPTATQVVVVAPRGVDVGGPGLEAVRTVQPFSPGDALSAAIRRSVGSLLVVIDPGVVLRADPIPALAQALADASVAIAGQEGVVSADMQHYHPAGFGDVTTLRSGCYAFRRADALERGPIDGRLHLPGSVAAWWALQLRDEGPARPPRRALALQLPVELPETAAPGAEHARLARRDAYRIARRFRGCAWLASELPPEGRLVGDRADGDDQHDDPDEQGHAAPA